MAARRYRALIHFYSSVYTIHTSIKYSAWNVLRAIWCFVHFHGAVYKQKEVHG